MKIYKSFGIIWGGRNDLAIKITPQYKWYFYGFTLGQLGFGVTARKLKKVRRRK